MVERVCTPMLDWQQFMLMPGFTSLATLIKSDNQFLFHAGNFHMNASDSGGSWKWLCPLLGVFFCALHVLVLIVIFCKEVVL